MKTCAIDHCANPIKHPKSGLCAACYSALYYWRGATPTQLVERRRKLMKFEARLDAMQKNVRIFRRRAG